MDSGRRRGRPPGASSGSTRAALLRAAREVFAEKGYAAASIAEIVARAQVSAPVLYHHFDSKAGLFVAATAAVYDEVVDRLEEAVAGRSSFGDCVDAIITASVRMHAHDPSMAAFIVSTPAVVQANTELAAAQPQFQRTEDLFGRIVRETGGVPGASEVESVRVLRMLVWGMTTLSATLRNADEFAGATDALRAVLFDGALRAAPEPLSGI